MSRLLSFVLLNIAILKKAAEAKGLKVEGVDLTVKEGNGEGEICDSLFIRRAFRGSRRL
jgi:hypothetical protein